MFNLKEEINQDLLCEIRFKFTEMDCHQNPSPKLFYLDCSISIVDTCNKFQPARFWYSNSSLALFMLYDRTAGARLVRTKLSRMAAKKWDVGARPVYFSEYLS